MNKTLRLEGLSCSACETKIERTLLQLDGVMSVNVNYVSSILTISYDEQKQTIGTITSELEKIGYFVVTDSGTYDTETLETKDQLNQKVSEKSDHKKMNYLLVSISGLLLFGAYFILINTNGFNFIPKITTNMGYGVLFVVGLLSSLHCVAMCGGLNLSLCISYQTTANQEHKSSSFWPSFLYNLGRVISYTIIGGIVGAIGSVFRISTSGSAIIAAIAGVFMIVMGLNMLNVFPWLRKLNPRIPKVLTRKIESKKKNKGPFIVGLLNGFMPCGPLQAMQLYALGTGSFLAGALSMLVFSLGTVPLMFLFGSLGSFLSSKATKKMITVSAFLVMLLGFIMLNRAFTLTGMSMGSQSTSEPTNSPEGTVATDNNIQKITTQLEAGTYPPITVFAGVPVEWTIIATEDNLNGCNGVIVIPEYQINQKLVVGENLITFTPTKSGTFGYSCWMGMIKSSITVLEKVEQPSEEDNTITENTNDTIDSGTVKSLVPEDSTKLPANCCSPGF